MSEMIRHFPITDGSVLSNNAAETVALYNPATAYSIGQFALRDTTHRIYISLADTNTGNTPEISPSKWADYGPANRWAMFDDSYRTQMTRASSLEFEVQGSGFVDSVALLNLTGSQARIMIRDSLNMVVHDKTYPLIDASAYVDLASYYYAPIAHLRDLYISNIPATANAKIGITITGPSTVGVGLMRAGLSIYIGDAQYGSSVGSTRYSIPNFSEFGVYTPIKRPNAKRGSFDMFIERGRVDSLFDTFADLDIEPTVFRMAGDETRGIQFAFIKEYEMTWSYPKHDRYRLVTEGLT